MCLSPGSPRSGWSLLGDLSERQITKAKALVDSYGVKVSCISRHNFAGLHVGATEIGDASYSKHMDGLRRSIATARAFDARLVRIMSFCREMILFGRNGADHWVVSKGAWSKLLKLLEPLGGGGIAPYLEPLAAALRDQGYDGVVSLESVYRPEGGDFEAGFLESVPVFKTLFG